MEFNQIRYFLAVCDTLNFTRAAEACAVSQPALTVAVRKLEDELGGPLFDRGGGSVEMTRLGLEMRDHLSRIARTRDAAKAAAAAVLTETAQPLHIGIGYTVGPVIFERCVAGYAKHDPSARLVLHDVAMTKYPELLRTGAIDAALIGSHRPPPPDCDFLAFCEEPMVLAMSRDDPLAATNIVTMDQLAAAPYLDRLRCDFRTDIMSMAEANGYALNIVAQSKREDWLLRLVASGLGVTMMSQSMAAAAGVVTRPVEGIEFPRRIGLARLKNAQSAEAERFADWVRTAFGID